MFVNHNGHKKLKKRVIQKAVQKPANVPMAPDYK